MPAGRFVNGRWALGVARLSPDHADLVWEPARAANAQPRRSGSFFSSLQAGSRGHGATAAGEPVPTKAALSIMSLELLSVGARSQQAADSLTTVPDAQRHTVVFLRGPGAGLELAVGGEEAALLLVTTVQELCVRYSAPAAAPRAFGVLSRAQRLWHRSVPHGAAAPDDPRALVLPLLLTMEAALSAAAVWTAAPAPVPTAVLW